MSTADPSRTTTIARLRAAGCVFAEQEADLLLAEAPDGDALERLIGRRVEGEPLEHVLGWAEFGGLRIAVGPGVFVPRRRTEFLAEIALAQLALARPVLAPTRAAPDPHPVVVDLCCGAGALGAVLIAADGRIALHAADIDERAVHYAQQNLAGTGAAVHRGDLFEALPTTLRGEVDVVVVNLPYVPTAAVGLLPPEARDHEPRVALDGGADGLDVFRRVIAQGGEWLRPGGRLLVELDETQVATAATATQRAGLVAETVDDPQADVTVLVAGRPR